MKKKIAPIIFIVMLISALFVLPGLAWGDAGGFSGGSDYGGGSSGGSSWGGSSSSGGSSYYYYGGSGSSSDSSDGGIGTIITIIVVIAILVMIRSRYKNSASSNRPAGATPTAESSLQPLTSLVESDPNFKETEMQDKISNLYVQMQNAWTAKDFTPMQPYFTDALYAQFDRQLDALRQNKQTNRVDNIAVLGVELRGWYEAEDNQCLVANVRTRIVDYTVDDRTGNIVSGSNTAEKFMTYEYTLVRTIGTLTKEQTGETETTACPNCGAPLNINQSTKCPYCGSIIKAKDFDWVLSAIKGISQETMD